MWLKNNEYYEITEKVCRTLLSFLFMNNIFLIDSYEKNLRV